MPQSKIRRQASLNDILFQKIIFNKIKLRHCEQKIINYCDCIAILKNICEKYSKLDIYTNYKNLLNFIITKKLNRRQIK